MGADFYQEDYLSGGNYGGGGNGYYDGGGAIDYGFDTTSWPTFDEYYGGGGLPPDYAPGFGPSSGFMDLGGGYLYDPSTGGVLDTGLYQGPIGSFDTGQSSDIWQTAYENWLGVGLDPNTAAQYAEADVEAIRASQGVISIPYSEAQQAPPPILPNLPEQYFALPPPPYDYGFWAGYSPTFPEEYFPLPPPPSDVAQPNLPPYCPAGQYHPYPIGHPQQNLCVAFPSAQQQAPKPPSATSGTPPLAPKPPAQQKPPTQQQCPQGYYRTSTGQCLPIPKCTTPETVFDRARGICVPRGQAVSPLPSEAEDLFANLKNIPWWVWLALGGAFLLSRDDGGKKTTVTYRRAR